MAFKPVAFKPVAFEPATFEPVAFELVAFGQEAWEKPGRNLLQLTLILFAYSNVVIFGQFPVETISNFGHFPVLENLKFISVNGQ